jgi:Phosphodiesterase/alkaline phosphatase D
MFDPKSLRAAVRHEGRVSRRLFLSYAAAFSVLPLLAESAASAAPLRRVRFQANPFSLGVASGDPDHESVVLWTKLAPEPLVPGGGMGAAAVEVRWEVAEDEEMKNVVQRGKATASRLLGHTVHVEVGGLKPDRWYWYRFEAGDARSPIGRTRTLPEPGAMPERLRFAFASCQHYEAGLFTAYEQMAKDELDLVFHLGDYIYEGAARDNAVRRHAGPKLFTLDEYRIRYAQYKSDPLLQAAHLRCPWFVTWDDHEVENNYAADISERQGVDPAEFLLHRANAYQAYYEMMPLRRRSIPRGPDLQLYRKASYGRLAELLILDTRQYRSDQVNGDRASDLNAAALDPKQSLLGAKQREWLQKSLAASPGTWNVLAQQVMMGMVDRTAGEEKKYSMDQWPGYAHERMALVKFMADRKVKNPVVLTGDIHANWVNDLRVDDRKPEMRVVATEFVGTSISSGGNGVDRPNDLDTLLAENPCLRFHNRQRGYVRCDITPSQWRSDYVVVDKVSEPGGKISTRASFVVEAGKPGAKLV